MQVEWLMAATPIVILALVLLGGFVGCALDDTPLGAVAISNVRVVVLFDPRLGAANGTFDVLLDFASDDDAREFPVLLNSETHQTEFVGDLLQFEFERDLQGSGYRIRCQVFARDDEDLLLNEGLSIVRPADCHVTIPAASDVRFEAGPDEREFTVSGCS